LLSTSIIAPNISSSLLQRRIEEISAGLQKAFGDKLLSISENNAATIVEYITTMKSEVNLSDNYRRDQIEFLSRLSKYNNKPLKDLTRVDVIAFLDSFRKTEAQDPVHKWIGTYNLFRTYLFRFFKWLYYPHLEPGKRPRPSITGNIAKLKRKEVSIYKPSDLWTKQDDLLFLKYCPSKRDRCYHAISRDL
jgi:hypothetical protein